MLRSGLMKKHFANWVKNENLIIDELGRLIVNNKKVLELINGASAEIDSQDSNDNSSCPHANDYCHNHDCADSACRNIYCANSNCHH